MTFAIDVLGWIGAAALLCAYWLVSTERTTGNSRRYQGMNLLGAMLVLANSLYYGALPSVGVNAVWIVIVPARCEARFQRARQASDQSRGRRAFLTGRRLHKQQQAETDGGEQAGEAGAIVEGLGNHRFRSHREQCSGAKCLQPRWPHLTE